MRTVGIIEMYIRVGPLRLCCKFDHLKLSPCLSKGTASLLLFPCPLALNEFEAGGQALYYIEAATGFDGYCTLTAFAISFAKSERVSSRAPKIT